jgi:hypothetical protein
MFPIKVMEERANPNDINLTLELVENRVMCEDVCRNEKRVESVLVLEKVIAQVDKLGMKINTIEIL